MEWRREVAGSISLAAGGAGTFRTIELVPPAEWSLLLSRIEVSAGFLFYRDVAVPSATLQATMALNPAGDPNICFVGTLTALPGTAFTVLAAGSIDFTQPLECAAYSRQRFLFTTSEDTALTLTFYGQLRRWTDPITLTDV